MWYKVLTKKPNVIGKVSPSKNLSRPTDCPVLLDQTFYFFFEYQDFEYVTDNYNELTKDTYHERITMIIDSVSEIKYLKRAFMKKFNHVYLKDNVIVKGFQYAQPILSFEPNIPDFPKFYERLPLILLSSNGSFEDDLYRPIIDKISNYLENYDNHEYYMDMVERFLYSSLTLIIKFKVLLWDLSFSPNVNLFERCPLKTLILIINNKDLNYDEIAKSSADLNPDYTESEHCCYIDNEIRGYLFTQAERVYIKLTEAGQSFGLRTNRDTYKYGIKNIEGDDIIPPGPNYTKDDFDELGRLIPEKIQKEKKHFIFDFIDDTNYVTA